ncbi:MAG: SpoIIE family protein phosphatase [bacterium]|nr:SpoIIE family protein phosphatase [bacterium]
MRNLTRIVFILFLLVESVFPVGPPIHFKQFSLDEGLSQNSILCVLQDQKGFMWFGTQDGLNKYDGYNFTVYRYDPDDSNSLRSSWIISMCEDGFGRLWVATNAAGLNLFDTRREVFKRFPINPNTQNAIDSLFIQAVCLDSDGAVWVGSNGNGLSKISAEEVLDMPGERKAPVTHYRNIAADPTSLSSNSITQIYKNRTGELWIGTANGLNRFNKENGTFTRYTWRKDDPEGLISNTITAIYEDSSGMLWIGTNAGLDLLEPETGKCYHYQSIAEYPTTLSSNVIISIYEDRSGVLWVGTTNGLNRFDKRSEAFTRYYRIGSDPNSLSDNTIFQIIEDSSRILWIGTNRGLNKFDREHKFQHYKNNPYDTNSLGNNMVRTICEDSTGVLWIGTQGGGLDEYNRSKGTFTHHRQRRGDTGSLSSDIIRYLYEDHTHTLWVGTPNGLNRFDREKRTFTPYFNNVNDPASLSSNFARCIVEDSNNILWIGTFAGGLNKYNRKQDNFSVYRNIPGNPNSLASNFVSVVYEAPSEPGTLWIGTGPFGLSRFDTARETFRTFKAAPGEPAGLSTGNILAIHEDRTGILWAGTFGGGLNKIIRKKDGTIEAVHFTEKQGLSNNSIYGILEDEKGHLWISTNRGISKFDPKKERFKNYNVLDGLQGNEFNSSAHFRSKSGEMFFGGLNGFNAFYPSRIEDNPYVPPVVINGFKLVHKKMPIGGDSPLQEAITYINELQFTYRQNSFLFEFSALDYTVPENNRYRYKLEGFDMDWRDTDAGRRFASYSNLDSGTYTFRVIGSNNDGVWNEEGAKIEIVILPPFWATLWFRGLVLLICLGILFLSYRKRLMNVRIMAELQTARDAQMSIMPQSDPAVEGVDISGVCVPAYEVGGDFFDYIWLNRGTSKFAIVVGDVSGKAMKSAMTAVMTSGMISSLISLRIDENESVKDIMSQVNRPLYFKTERRVFTALCMACLDLQQKEMVFTNAGLNDPLLISGNSISKLKGTGLKLPLGVRADSVYLESKHKLKSGDVIIFYTDGVTEAKNSADEFYGHDAFIKLLETISMTTHSARAIKDGIIAGVEAFVESAPQHDDITVVVVKIL